MSYIIKETNPFIRVKLTEIGRQRLATGQLTFNQWAVGDSEIDYGYVLPNPPGVDEQILKPKDQQPNIKTYLKKADGTIKTTLGPADLKILGITINNPADERGFFNPAGTPAAGWGIQTSTTYVKASGTIACANFTGGYTIDLGTTNFDNCDFVLFIFSNSTSGAITTTANLPVPYLWYKIVSAAGSTVTLDRELPNMPFIGCGGNIQFFVYPGCEDPINTYYGSGCTSAYWNTGTLTFDSCCDISIADVPVWNQNNVWCEDMIGTQSTTATHREYGSIDYIGEKNYLGYPCDCGGVAAPSLTDICAPGGSTQQDPFQKGIGIIHYTNNTISNFYGEFFYIDATQNKLLILDVPTVMWHRRNFGGSGTGNLLGMRFVSDGTLKTLPNTDIQYYDLLEDAAYVSSPIVVGRVYPQLKVIVISDEELLATMSFKSNRNWSLPMLKANLVAPASAPGLLAPGETLYLTYTIRPTDGLKPSLPCQKYIVLTNNASSTQDVSFTIEGTGLLPYMKKIEAGWDGFGFYGQEFVLLSQIVSSSGSCRPDPAMWKETVWTDPSGETLDPLDIENQNPAVNDFILTADRYSTGTTYNIETQLNVPTAGNTTILNFGDERFFYGNLETYIGAKIFKTVFSLNVDRSQFSTTTNPTYTSSNGGIFNITEVGIYDNIGNLVMIGKFSSPIPLGNGAIANIEMTLDF